MWNIPAIMDAAQEHYQKLLDEAEEHRRFHKLPVHHVSYAASARHLLLILSNALIGLGMRIRAICDANTLGVPQDEVVHKAS